ncbi:BnaC06g13050D [Brassica napus]|uniref:BnaC06g13050D protein n=1 Tax=Brassica napus TaxID=3708 RepID=A0A078FFD3_BRANA|nr:BnaC06g13050D [Brassica napus]
MILLQLDLLHIVMFDIVIHDIGIGHLLLVRY